MYSEEIIRQRFQEISDDFEGDLKYPEEFFDVAIREIVSEEYRDLPVEELEALVINELTGMPPMVIEGFFSSLKKIGKKVWKRGKKLAKKVGKVAKKALPIVQKAAPLLSFVPGVGPVAMGIGGAAGVLGNLMGSKGKAPGAIGKLGSLINNPKMLQAVAAQMLPKIGRKSIPVGRNKTRVPVGAFMNLLGMLTNKAAAEMNALGTGTQETPNYLIDQEGELLCDPAVPEERARVLWKLLEEADREEQPLYGYPGYEYVPEFLEPEEYYLEDEFEDIDDDDEEFYDEMDLVETYYEDDDDDEMELAEAYGEEDDDDEMEFAEAYGEDDDDDEMEFAEAYGEEDDDDEMEG
jgi:hypothetical protein